MSWTSCAGKTVRNVSDEISSNNDSVTPHSKESALVLGADRPDQYLPYFKNKSIGVVANQTSIASGMHLVDYLVQNGVSVKKVFAPEHGFRGEAGPGDKVSSGIDAKTGIPIISLYGSKRRPSKEDLGGLDLVVFDIQDVGARFYTYISTLHYVMEECALYGIEVWVLDRPNPNGFYVDGPVLNPSYSSFVGVAPIPVVHGLTVGEYARMVNGEGWLKDSRKCEIKVVEMLNYTHQTYYELPVSPSPNLKDMDAIFLYPTLCFFEGAAVSVGRGTPHPFTWVGFPGYKGGDSKLTPQDIPGVIKDPPYEGQLCDGKDLRAKVPSLRKSKQLNLELILEIYNAFPDKLKFFNSFFEKLAGTD
ncbi:MAG: exo-beta-N-acetylmuramidase NamZ domain-containing protein, partial [Bacteroidota bacterium]